jgi:hypothetical protein
MENNKKMSIEQIEKLCAKLIAEIKKREGNCNQESLERRIDEVANIRSFLKWN